MDTGEDKVQASRRFYNGNVRDFQHQVFPTVLGLGFTAREFFEAAESEKAVPQSEIQRLLNTWFFATPSGMRPIRPDTPSSQHRGGGY